MDSHPWYLLGGHASKANAVAESALACASMSSWMSVASNSTTQSVEKLMALVTDLNALFGQQSFLTLSAMPTLADLELYGMLVPKIKKEGISLEKCVDLVRYLNAVQARMEQLVMLRHGGSGSPLFSCPSLEGVTLKDDPVPMLFHDATEADLAPPTTGKAPKPTLQAASKAPTTQPNDTKPKKEKTPKKPQPTSAKASKSTPAPPVDISALELKVGHITKVWPHPDSDKLWCEEIDLGEETPRQILSGLRAFYSQSEMEDSRVVVLANLKAKKLGGIPSHGMVLCASNSNHTSVELMHPPANAKVGERVMFEGVEMGDPKPENQVQKKKLLEQLVPEFLKTNEEGVLVWKNHVSCTSDGPCVASKGMKNAQVS